jgi:hypothetical protein
MRSASGMSLPGNDTLTLSCMCPSVLSDGCRRTIANYNDSISWIASALVIGDRYDQSETQNKEHERSGLFILLFDVMIVL